jgi:hypothetical protein
MFGFILAAALTTSTPEQAYVTAVQAMRALAIPAKVAYHSVWTSTGGGFAIRQDDTRVVIEGGIGRAFLQHADYDVTFASEGRIITVATPTDHLRGTGSRLLDPTWAGAYDILRYGLHGESPIVAAPAAAPAASSAPLAVASSPAPETTTLGTVVAISPAFYHVTDRGSTVCSNGDPGRALALAAYSDPRAHPLTAVTIDTTNDRFCAMQFNLNETGVLGVTGDYGLTFAQTGGYWLVSGGFADISARVMGISAKHVVLHWTNSAIRTADLDQAGDTPR